MTGELLAILAALAYGAAGVSIVGSKSSSQGDNGVFLSVALTAGLSWLLWLGWGNMRLSGLGSHQSLAAIGTFILAGLSANALGRLTMYRATERIGPVQAGMLRRLTPVFALPCAFVLLNERPGPMTLLGAMFILVAVLVYRPRTLRPVQTGITLGVLIGILSALAYALAYTLRSAGMKIVPDAALGACIGALAGAVFLMLSALLTKGMAAGWRHITIDRRPAHWRTGLALSIGQILQFFALKSASVVSVAVLGALDALFSALIILALTQHEALDLKKLFLATLLALAGTALLFSG